MPEEVLYDTLKASLLETHTLSDKEKTDVLFQMELLDGHKLLQLLASMLAYCPPAMKQTSMLQYMFLQRLREHKAKSTRCI